MSDLNEEYQDQVLEDLSDIKESVTTDSGYEEKVLDDLDEIKESVSEEQEYYDKKYQKEVLGSLRSLEKSVQALNVNYESFNLLASSLDSHYVISKVNNTTCRKIYLSSTMGDIYVFDISNRPNLFLSISSISNPSTYGSGSYFRTHSILTNLSYNEFTALSTSSDFLVSDYIEYTSAPSYYQIDNSSDYHYLYVAGADTSGVNLYHDGSVINEESGDVTSGSAVMVDGIDTLIQISTFQGFASALLTGILLFLVFVKGLRR